MIRAMHAKRSIGWVRRWWWTLCVAMVLSTALPSTSRADENTPPPHDARLDGYPQGVNVVLDSNGTAFTYVVMCLVGAITLGVMFIAGKRTHLD
jgi:hypothetical protein